MSNAQTQKPQEEKIKKLFHQKQEISLKIRELRAEMGKLNVQLSEAGASVQEIVCW